MWVGGVYMKSKERIATTLTGVQAICGVSGTLGTIGKMEQNAHMTIGEGVLQVIFYFGLIMFFQFLKELTKVIQKQKACSESRTFRTRKAYICKHQTVR
jgi:hypothetical protein